MRRVFLNFVETDFCQICFQVMGTRNLQLAKYVEASIILFVSLCFSAGARQSSLENQLTVMCWFLGLRQGLSVPDSAFLVLLVLGNLQVCNALLVWSLL